MKILHLNDHYEKLGGAEVILFQILEALERRGVQNVVVHEHPAKADFARGSHRIPNLGSVFPQGEQRFLSELREIVNREDPDAIHIHNIGNPAVAAACCALRPTLQSVLGHSFYCPGGLKYLPRLNRECHRAFGPGCLASAFLTHCNSIRPGILWNSYRLSRQMMRRVHTLFFLTPSEFQARWLLKNGIPAERVQVLHPFAELPQESASTAETSAPELLFAGRIFPQKGLHIVLSALRYVTSPFHLTVAGDGPDWERSKTLVNRFGFSANVSFPGWCSSDTLTRYYRNSHLVIVPAIWPEPFGIVGIEAMSYAKPVVAFRVGGIPEWLEDGVTGLLAAPGNAQDLAKKISILLENPEMAREMGRKGRQSVEARFAPQQHISRLMEIYARVVREWKLPIIPSKSLA